MSGTTRRRFHLRSMRTRAVLVAVAVALLPIAVVAASRPLESGLEARMLQRVQQAAKAARTESAATVALRTATRVRVLRGDRVVEDVDKDSASWISVVSGFLLGDPESGSPATLETALPPPASRPEVQQQGAACHRSEDLAALLCGAAQVRADGAVVYVTHTSRRAVGALLGVRYQIVKLSLLLLPVAVLLGLYLGWRMGVLTDALQERNARNEAFVADLAHEMKNPIAAIRAAGELLDDGGERNGRVARVLDDGSRRLDALVSALLELARAEAGSTRDERVSVDVALLVQNLVDARLDRARIQLELAPLTVNAAPRDLEAVVRNLLDNAASFGAAVRVRMVQRQLIVEDDGPGIDAAVLPRVFERFFTTRGERQGTGLGLALAKALAEAHGATLTAQSPAADGHGARFVVDFG